MMLNDQSSHDQDYQLPKIIFAGTPHFSANILQHLHKSQLYNIVAVLTKEDKASGRGQKITYTPVKKYALEHGIPIIQPRSFQLDGDSVYPILESMVADLMIVVAYGLLLPNRLLQIPRLGCINIHASLLPYFRGAAPIHYAILQGSDKTGIVFMQMDKGLDTGDVLSSFELEDAQLSHMTMGQLHDSLCNLAVNKINDFLRNFFAGNITPKKQNNNLASYAPRIAKSATWINWEIQTGDAIERQIRAFNPSPQARSYIMSDRGGLRLVILESSFQAISSNETQLYKEFKQEKFGTIIDTSKGKIVVKVIGGFLHLNLLQIEGGRPQSSDSLLRGNSGIFMVGNRFLERPQ